MDVMDQDGNIFSLRCFRVYTADVELGQLFPLILLETWDIAPFCMFVGYAIRVAVAPYLVPVRYNREKCKIGEPDVVSLSLVKLLVYDVGRIRL